MSDLLPQWVAFKLGRYLNQLTWYATHTVVMPDSHHRRLTRQIWGAVERLTIELSLSDRGGGLRRQVAKLGRDWDEYLETEHYCEGWQETVRYYDTDQGHQHLAENLLYLVPTELTKVVQAVEHEIFGRTRQILLLQLGRCIDEGVRPPHFPSALRFRTVRSHAGPRLYPRSDDTHLALRGIRCRSGSLSPGLVWPAEVRRLWHEAGLDEAASQLPADVPGTRRERLSAVRRLVEQARRLLTESGCQYVHLPAGREQANDGDGWPPDDGWHFHSNNHVAAFQRHVFELKYPIHYRLLKCLAHARFAVPDDRLIEAGWEGETSTKKNLQNHLSQLRVTLRSQFGLDHQVDPIPVRGVGADAVWCLDSESLKKGSKLSADRESS